MVAEGAMPPLDSMSIPASPASATFVPPSTLMMLSLWFAVVATAAPVTVPNFCRVASEGGTVHSVIPMCWPVPLAPALHKGFTS